MNNAVTKLVTDPISVNVDKKTGKITSTMSVWYAEDTKTGLGFRKSGDKLLLTLHRSVRGTADMVYQMDLLPTHSSLHIDFGDGFEAVNVLLCLPTHERTRETATPADGQALLKRLQAGASEMTVRFQRGDKFRDFVLLRAFADVLASGFAKAEQAEAKVRADMKN